MGNSRALFAAAFAAIVGLYSFGIRKADTQLFIIPASKAYSTQAREIAESGVKFNLSKIVRKNAVYDHRDNVPFMKGTLSTTVVNLVPFGIDEVYVKSIGEYRGRIVTSESWWERVKNNKFKMVRSLTKETFARPDGEPDRGYFEIDS